MTVDDSLGKTDQIGKFIWARKRAIKQYLLEEYMYISESIEIDPPKKTVTVPIIKEETPKVVSPSVLQPSPKLKIEDGIKKSDPVFDALQLMAKQMTRMSDRIDSLMNINSKLAKMSPEKRKAIEMMIETFGD